MMSRRAWLAAVIGGWRTQSSESTSTLIALMPPGLPLLMTDQERDEGYASVGADQYGLIVRPGTIYHTRLKALQDHVVDILARDHGPAGL